MTTFEAVERCEGATEQRRDRADRPVVDARLERRAGGAGAI